MALSLNWPGTFVNTVVVGSEPGGSEMGTDFE